MSVISEEEPYAGTQSSWVGAHMASDGASESVQGDLWMTWNTASESGTAVGKMATLWGSIS